MKDLTRISLSFIQFASFSIAAIFEKYHIINETRVVGNVRVLYGIEDGYLCCQRCTMSGSATIVNHNRDTKICELADESDGKHLQSKVSAGWKTFYKSPTDVILRSSAIASQSSEHKPSPGPASRAIDGNTDGIYRSRSCTHTNINKHDAHWWMLDIQRHVFVSSVILWNRLDEGVWEHLRGIEVRVASSKQLLKSEKNVCGNYTGPPRSVQDNPIRIDCKRVMFGRFLEIEKTNDATALSLCEVQVI